MSTSRILVCTLLLTVASWTASIAVADHGWQSNQNSSCGRSGGYSNNSSLGYRPLASSNGYSDIYGHGVRSARKTTATTDKGLAVMQDLVTETTCRINPIVHDQVTTHLDTRMPVETATPFTTACMATTILFQEAVHSNTKEMLGAAPVTNTRTIHRGLAGTPVGDVERP